MLLLCKDEIPLCMTNDKKLRKIYFNEGFEVLRMLLLLVKHEKIIKERAKSIELGLHGIWLIF